MRTITDKLASALGCALEHIVPGDHPDGISAREALAEYDAARDNGETFAKVPEQPDAPSTQQAQPAPAGDHSDALWQVDAGAFAIIIPRSQPEYCDEVIAVIPQGLTDEDDAAHLANARRIVACVNACAGLATDQLEQTKLRPMLEACEGFMSGFEGDESQDRQFQLDLDDVRETLGFNAT